MKFRLKTVLFSPGCRDSETEVRIQLFSQAKVREKVVVVVVV